MFDSKNPKHYSLLVSKRPSTLSALPVPMEPIPATPYFSLSSLQVLIKKMVEFLSFVFKPYCPYLTSFKHTRCWVTYYVFDSANLLNRFRRGFTLFLCFFLMDNNSSTLSIYNFYELIRSVFQYKWIKKYKLITKISSILLKHEKFY